MDVSGLLRKAAEKCGFNRERFEEKKIPTDPANISVMPFFGDIRSLFVLSSILLNRYRLEDKGSKYFVLASWPGFQALFPYVDEFWGIADEQIGKKMYSESCQFRNKSSLTASYYRNLNQYFFEDVSLAEDVFKSYYHQGIKDDFWKKYKHVRRTLPGLQSSAVLKDFNRDLMNQAGFKVFVYPTMYIQTWSLGDVKQIAIKKDFWVHLCNRLVKEGFVPVIYRGFLSHDIAADLTDNCVYVSDPDIGKALAAMRATGCVLDIFGGISRLAIAARTPFLAVEDRSRYAAMRDYEIDDLCGNKLAKQYIFGFPTIIEGGIKESWDYNIVNSVIARLNLFLPGLDRDSWPLTGESTEIIPYDTVRKKKLKRMGTRLLRVPKD